MPLTDTTESCGLGRDSSLDSSSSSGDSRIGSSMKPSRYIAIASSTLIPPGSSGAESDVRSVVELDLVIILLRSAGEAGLALGLLVVADWKLERGTSPWRAAPWALGWLLRCKCRAAAAAAPGEGGGGPLPGLTVLGLGGFLSFRKDDGGEE